MRSEHRAPFVASIVVVLACIGVMAHAVRTDALDGIARRTPMAFIAGAMLQPKPEVGSEAPRPQAAEPVVPQAVESSKAPAKQPAKSPKPPATRGQGAAHGTAQGKGSAHTSAQPVADAQAVAAEPEVTPPPAAVVATPPATPTRGFGHSHTSSSQTPTSSSTSTPSTPTQPGRGHGWGQGLSNSSSSSNSLGHSIVTALTSLLTGSQDRDYGDRGNHWGYGDRGSNGDRRAYGYGNDPSDSHHGWRGHRSWR